MLEELELDFWLSLKVSISLKAKKAFMENVHSYIKEKISYYDESGFKSLPLCGIYINPSSVSHAKPLQILVMNISINS